MPKTLRNAKSGDVAQVGYRDHLEPHEFLGFSDWHGQYGESGPVFATAADLFSAMGVSSFRGMDEKLAGEEYGYGVYAFFRNVETGHTWRAYRFNGFWAVGTSADRLKIR